MITKEDLKKYSSINVYLKDRCYDVYERYAKKGIVPIEYNVCMGKFTIDFEEETIKMFAGSVDDDYDEFIFNLPISTFLSDDEIEKDIKKRLVELRGFKMNLNEMKGHRVYISGKMTGLSVYEIFERFNRVENILVENGNAVINPDVLWFLKDTNGFDRDQYLHVDYAMMDICDTVIVLPEYEDSYGVDKELKYAIRKANMEIYYLNDKDELFVNRTLYSNE